MNYLFHMLLSGDDEQLLVGNFMGDFVKGPLQDRFPPWIRFGVYLHRKIDSYADQHPIYRHSRQCLSPEYGLYRGVMLDLFYDYFLVNDWSTWCNEPLCDYLARTRTVIERHIDEIPPEMHRFIPIVFNELLPSYGTIEGIGNALGRISCRLIRKNPLLGSEAELARKHNELQEDFRLLTPELFCFAAEISVNEEM